MQHPRVRRWRHVAHPVDEQQSQVRNRVTQGADFPVEDCSHFAVRVEHRIVESIVAVHYRHSLLAGNGSCEFVGDGLDNAVVINALDAHLFVLGAPSTELSLDITTMFRQVAESGFVNVDVVQLGEGASEMLADHAPRF